ncbi:chaperone for general secretion pathway YbaY [Parashewanella spongiae]|uniref:Chaperone for general secretion pathway YbaY n=1 Tax=Parashewanella spongiae TaxID=342950 RepID=A0A3A6U8P0_9GAMM|nr:YbaY family lipoprotein [Parashewanella spongiae]MCL1077560.1 YbaY family lipoprotein [Parashewanella spongiae]RJY18300.1 chaperone for general secretion pathway YbaY [Parashewanella spongiae]
MKKLIMLFILTTLAACVTVTEEPPIVINGAAGYNERVMLPPGSTVTIAIIDLDTPGVIIAQKNFNVARAPIPFKFILPSKSIDKSINYGVVALIKNQGQLLFQTYDRYQIINNGSYTVEILMKMVKK